MPRGRKRTTEPTESILPLRRRRRRKAQSVAPATVSDVRDPKLVEAEAELIAKYGDRIKRGSLLPAGAVPDFGTKRTLIIICEDCQTERRVATSDVFHVSRCVNCAKKARRKNKKEEAAE